MTNEEECKCKNKDCLNRGNYGVCYQEGETCQYALHQFTHDEIQRLCRLEKLLREEKEQKR